MIAALLALAAARGALVLDADGLGLPGGRSVRFGVLATTATARIAAVAGAPVRRGTYPDCGQGIAIAHADFAHGLELSFIKGRFVGWTVDARGLKAWRSAKGIGLGSTLAEMRRAYGDTSIDDNGDDAIMAVSERGPSGFLDGRGPGARITSLHAGQTCIVD